MKNMHLKYLLSLLILSATGTQAALILYTAEGDTTAATDQLTSDGSQNGTFVNGVTVNTDPVFGSNAYGFPAKNTDFDVIDMGEDSRNLGNSFTLAVQAKTASTLYQRMFSGYSGSGTVTSTQLTFDLDIDNIGFGWGLRAIINGVATTATLPGTATDNKYHHYAVTYDNTGLVTLYFDGTSITSNNVDAATITLAKGTLNNN